MATSGLPKTKGIIFFAVLFTAAISAATGATAEVVVVVSAKSPVSKLTTTQVARIFLAKASTFPGDGTAVPLDQAEGAAVRNEFNSKVTGKDASQHQAYWSKLIFAGDGQPPRVVSGDEQVKRALANDPNAIGYIDIGAVDGSVKVLLRP